MGQTGQRPLTTTVKVGTKSLL